MVHQWLEDNENQLFLYEVSKELIEKISPEELLLFEELFPQYVEVVQKHDVEVGTGSKGAFSFSGTEELITLLCLPGAATFVAGLLMYKGVSRIAEIRDATPDDFESIWSKRSGKMDLSSRLQDQIINTIIKALEELNSNK